MAAAGTRHSDDGRLGVSNPTEEQWQHVHRLVASGQRERAREVLRWMIARDSSNVPARLRLATLLTADDHQRDAVAQTIEASRHPPATADSLCDLVASLIWVGELAAAHRLLDSPLLAACSVPSTLMRAAGQHQAIGENVSALALMDRAHAAGADGRNFLFHHAVQLAFNGRLDEARDELERCIALRPPLGGAFVQLARMRKYTPEYNHVDRLHEALAQVQPGGLDHAALEFALFEELDDMQRHDEAWQALVRGNAVMHARMPFDADRAATLLDNLTQLCTASFVRSLDDGDTGPQPIFIVGLPRSGTTVLERMLGNHSQITSAGELGDFPRALFLATDHLPHGMFDDITLASLPSVDWRRLGDSYLAQTRWRARGRPFFVDKLPRNWMVAGLIHKALPRARILHIIRDPMGVCFSNWRAFFGPDPEYAYAYDLQAMAAQHRMYRTLMSHWHEVAPGRIFDVDYDALVHQPADTIEAILAFCGLPNEPGCADLARNKAPSATLSMSQVRQPLRTDMRGAWRPYAAPLAGLQESLQPRHRDP